MQSVHVFDGITEEELAKMIVCFHAQIKEFDADNKLSSNTTNTDRVGVILEGEADLIKYDQDGYRNIIEHLSEQDIFGHTFFQPFDDSEIDVISTCKCKVIYFDYEHLIKRCEKACLHHSILVSNVLQIFSNKTRQLHSRIETLSQRSIRNKLLTYFQQMTYKNNSNSFQLPFSLNSL